MTEPPESDPKPAPKLHGVKIPSSEPSRPAGGETRAQSPLTSGAEERPARPAAPKTQADLVPKESAVAGGEAAAPVANALAPAKPPAPAAPRPAASSGGDAAASTADAPATAEPTAPAAARTAAPAGEADASAADAPASAKPTPAAAAKPAAPAAAAKPAARHAGGEGGKAVAPGLAAKLAKGGDAEQEPLVGSADFGWNVFNAAMTIGLLALSAIVVVSCARMVMAWFSVL